MLLWTIIIIVGLYMILKNNPAPAPQMGSAPPSRWGRRPPYGGHHPGHGHWHGGGPGGGHHGGGGWDHDD